MPIDRSTAIKLIRKRIEGHRSEMIVLEDRILEREWGWYVPWMAQIDYTNDYPPAPGISPFLVRRSDGELQVIGTAPHHIKEAVRAFLGARDGDALLLDIGFKPSEL